MIYIRESFKVSKIKNTKFWPASGSMFWPQSCPCLLHQHSVQFYMQHMPNDIHSSFTLFSWGSTSFLPPDHHRLAVYTNLVPEAHHSWKIEIIVKRYRIGLVGKYLLIFYFVYHFNTCIKMKKEDDSINGQRLFETEYLLLEMTC